MKKLLAALALSLGLASSSIAAQFSGAPSTGTISVGPGASLQAAKASGTLTVVSTQGARGGSINIGPLQLREGTNYQSKTSTAATAISIKNAINAQRVANVTASTTSADVVTITAGDFGTLYNSYGLKSSTPDALTAGASTLTGGLNNAALTIKGRTLTQGAQWFVADDSSGTAMSLALAINLDPTLGPLLTATASSTTVSLSSRLTNEAFLMSSSIPTVLRPSAAAMSGGSSGAISPAAVLPATTLGGALTATSATLSGALTATLAAASLSSTTILGARFIGARTSAQIQALTATAGDVVLNSDLMTLCPSSGTTRGAYVLPMSTSTTVTPRLACY